MSEVKLKPCPFCGSEAVLIGTEKENWVECTNKDCGCEVFLGCVNDKAIKAWNTRKPVDKILEQLEEEKKKPGLYVYAVDAYDKAIEFVKGGGAND